MTSTTVDAAETTEVRDRAAWKDRLADHGPFLVALLLAIGLRVVAHVAVRPILVYSDGPSYLDFLDAPEPIPSRPAGYPLLVLQSLSWLTDSLVAVAAVQHLIGLTTATLVYAVLRRRGVGRWLATLAALPVLFDSLQLVLEHSVLSDALFQLLVVLGIVALAWERRPSLGPAFGAGLIFGLAATVRVVGEPLLLSGVVFCLLVGRDWRRRLAGAAAVVMGFLAPVTAYAAWYHDTYDTYALSQFSGKSLYLRTTSFVDCSTFSVPEYQRVLCPPEPVDGRLEPTYYVFHDDRLLDRLSLPVGTTEEDALGDFARRAITSQPLAYVRTVLRDFMLNFDVERTDRFGLDTFRKWQFFTYIGRTPTERETETYLGHGGALLSMHQPWVDRLSTYQRYVFLPGPVQFSCLVVGLLAGFGAGRARRSGMRAVCLLFTVSGAGLILVPAITAEFTWRYHLPALALLPAGAALAITALRGGDVDETAATTPDSD